MSFVFYDTETTGTVTAFDQILQFAAIKTDADLNELDRFEIRCRLLPHVVPAPGAMRVTGVTVAQLFDPAFCSHYEMIRQIRVKLLAWSPAIILGYNSLGYDEHILRQALYKTLHPPYLTNTNGNCRADVLRMVRAASVFAPGAIVIPADDEKNIFKLDRIAPANGFDHSAAHDALADVNATIHLCRLLMSRAPAVWSTAMRFSQKASVIDYIGSERIFCWCEFYFGNAYSWLVTPIGTNPGNGSEFYVYDLQVDPETLALLSDEDLEIRLSHSPKPVRRLKCNASPMLTPVEEAPAFAAASVLGVEELERRADMLENDDQLRARLIAALEAGRAPKDASPHIELQIYDGFWPKTDEFLMESFHAVPWEKRLGIAEKLQDPRLKTIAIHLIHIERPELLEPLIGTAHDQSCARRVLGLDGEVPWLTLPKAIEQAEAMLIDCDELDRAQLQEHCFHLRDWLDRAKAIIACSEQSALSA
jgi:exodeoxyribonuclease I